MKISLKQAASLIRSGSVVAIPTETVYGLAASICSPAAIGKIFAVKGRPADNPLIVHVSGIRQMRELVKSVPASFAKIKNFWPGPLTIVLPAECRRVPRLVRAGLKTVAVRMPAHPLALKLIRQTGPLAAPSANLSGRPSPTSRRHVEQDLGAHFPVLDGGPCRKGVESTVIALTEDSWEILRAGAISREQIQKTLQLCPRKQSQSPRLRSPGQKYRHYAPQARLILCHAARDFKKRKADAVLGFTDTVSPLKKISLGPRNHFSKNLQKLYAALRFLDQKKYGRVLVDWNFDKSGLGATLAERLRKAAGK